MMQARSEFKQDYRRGFLELYADYILKIQDNLRAGMEQGLFRDLDIGHTAGAISAVLQGSLQNYYIRSFGDTAQGEGHARDIAPEKLTDRSEAVAELILSGLLKRNQDSS